MPDLLGGEHADAATVLNILSPLSPEDLPLAQTAPLAQADAVAVHDTLAAEGAAKCIDVVAVAVAGHDTVVVVDAAAAVDAVVERTEHACHIAPWNSLPLPDSSPPESLLPLSGDQPARNVVADIHYRCSSRCPCVRLLCQCRPPD